MITDNSTAAERIEAVMAGIAAALTATNAFPTVRRSSIVTQAFETSVKPAAGTWRFIDRDDVKKRSSEKVIDNLVIVVELIGVQSGDPQQDQEMITLRQTVNDALTNQTFGGACQGLDQRGTEASLSMNLPAGFERMAFEAIIVSPKQPLV